MNAKTIAALQHKLTTIDPSCRLYIPFNEGTGNVAKDYSQYGNNGVLTDVKWDVGGGGNACEFNGTSAFVDCGNDASLDITGAITIEVWMKPNQLASWDVLVLKANGTLWSQGYGIIFTSDSIRFYISIWDSYYSSKSFPFAASLGNWYHVVGTYDKQHIRIYVNGVIGTPMAHTSAITLATETLEIGRGKGDAFTFNGTIDEVRIFNRALSAQEIRASYDATKPRYGPV